MCKCGHYKSQHPNKICDYAGYSCNCTGYKALKKGEAIDSPNSGSPRPLEKKNG